MLEFNNGKDAEILPKSDSQNRHEDVEYPGVEESYESSHGIRENLDVKKRNHLNCEKRRRENIKLSLQQLHDALPQKYSQLTFDGYIYDSWFLLGISPCVNVSMKPTSF